MGVTFRGPGALRQALVRLRRLLGQNALVGSGDKISLAPELVSCDVAQFEALIRDGGRHAMAEAVDPYDGRLLSDLSIPQESWSNWLDSERQRLENLALDTMIQLGDEQLAAGNAAAVLRVAQRAIAIDNLREDAHRHIIRALAICGRKADALRHYEQLAVLLKRELDVEPDPSTKALACEVRQHSAMQPTARDAAEPKTEALGVEPGQAEPERRQLSIMSCELIWGGRDPEDMREALRAYRSCVTKIVGAFQGFIAKQVVNTVLVYFGYPVADETDAERAVRAGLALYTAVASLTGIAELLAVPVNGRYPALEVSPRRKREMTLSSLLNQLESTATLGPVLLVFEDAHWIDPTSRDLLDRIVARVADLPVLLVITYRSEFQPTWIGLPHVTMLILNRLGHRDAAGIILSIAHGKALPEAVTQEILNRTDGVPLFIEELTTALLESGIMRETPDRYIHEGPLPPFAIPATLQASLAARLDRLHSARGVAQIGATIGREFTYDLISEVAAIDESELKNALESMTQSGWCCGVAYLPALPTLSSTPSYEMRLTTPS